MLCRDLLALRSVKEIQVRFCNYRCAVFVCDFVDNSDWRFSKDADRGHDNFDFILSSGFGRKIGLVFPGYQNVSNASLDERGGRSTSSGIQHWNIFEKLLFKFQCPGFAVGILLQGITPRGKVIPSRAAGG